MTAYPFRRRPYTSTTTHIKNLISVTQPVVGSIGLDESDELVRFLACQHSHTISQGRAGYRRMPRGVGGWAESFLRTFRG